MKREDERHGSAHLREEKRAEERGAACALYRLQSRHGFQMSDPRRRHELEDAIDKMPKDQFKMGMKVELEHGKRSKKTDITHNDPVKTAKIVLAHLKEDKKYYSKLKKMELYRNNYGNK